MELEKKIAEGFQTSAYRGVTGKIAPTQPDDSVSNDGLRFAQLISNKLEPFPLRKCSLLQHQAKFEVSTTNNKTHTLRDAIPPPSQPASTSKDGVVLNGLRDSRGFLETLTSTQRMKGSFSDEVMDAYAKGIESEKLLEEQRLALQHSEFSSCAPNPWMKSTHDHANFSRVDEEAYRPGYHSRHNLVSDSDTRRKKVHEQILKGNSVDRDALVEHLESVHQKTMPRGYQAASGSKWQTTTKSTFSKFDLAAATASNDKFALMPHATGNVIEGSLPDRKLGEHATEVSDSFAWRGPVDQETKFRHRGALDIVNGVYTMSSKYHHPRADVQTGASYNPSEIVQGQYVPSSKLSIPAKN